MAEGRALLMVRGAPVLMVETDPVRVELALRAGELACPRCGVVAPYTKADFHISTEAG